MPVARNAVVAGLLSFVAPGLGQLYRGERLPGALILAAAIVIGNLNIIILPLISVANPVLPLPPGDPRALWAYWIPRYAHDVLAFWSIVFWLWAVGDAVRTRRVG